ncbi:P-loop NTPase fold protein [Roseofilum sp. Guam]|uniref:P-loop NTPase fold protein n=1 Tax=Roseofilum sp. Guam TaxID=2821502 RepID=UPI001B11C0DE|nr:P-loop NTPase fold protein [Roseofilum sp. Guam]MBP0028390.1 AAA family ATPase [Roseofilum sp. Guam]
MNETARLLKALFNSFRPDVPLEHDDPRYVDCNSVRGDEDILVQLGGPIKMAENNACLLYSGHRGGGKSTELKRLKKDLEDYGFVVVYFAAATEDEGDLSFQDTQYQDILLSCTRQLLKELEGKADPSPIANWLKSRWKELTDLALTEVSFDNFNVSIALSQFTRITAVMRTEPSKRRKIRELVEPNTESLVKALNEFIDSAKASSQNTEKKVVIIADNLDRIVPIQNDDNGQTNLEDIYVNRSELMRGLKCDIIYTAPIALLYSRAASELQDIYGTPQVLPMIMVESQDGQVLEAGMNKLRTALEKRAACASDLELVPHIFDSEETVQLLCVSCGGHLRDLMHMVRDAINQSTELPIKEKAVKRAIGRYRRGYMETLQESDWPLLFNVYHAKRKYHEPEYRDLLYRRCILEYCFVDEYEAPNPWHTVHPLIRGSKLFKERWQKYQEETNES